MDRLDLKALYAVLLLVEASSCVELSCYSNLDFAKMQGDKFCSQGSGNRDQCESLIIFDKKVCKYQEKDNHTCEIWGQGIEVFARIPSNECRKLDQKICRTKKSCEWTFNDPVEMRFTESTITWP